LAGETLGAAIDEGYDGLGKGIAVVVEFNEVVDLLRDEKRRNQVRGSSYWGNATIESFPFGTNPISLYSPSH
jgi:hypothetical protein